MDDSDFLLDDDGDYVDDSFIVPTDEEDEEDEELDLDFDDEDSSTSSRRRKDSVKDFEGKLTENEVAMSFSYTLIKKADNELRDEKVSLGGGLNFPQNVLEAVKNVLNADPNNTSKKYIDDTFNEIFHQQGHNRIPASVYSPNQSLRGSDLGEEFGQLEDDGINIQLAKDSREQIANFIEYLSSRDLSKDSPVSRKKKLRQLPALIIFLFSSSMFDLIINCPTMPPEYAKQIHNAFQRIQQRKYDVVEELAQAYENAGRQAIADKVRKLGVRWFDLEPNEITSRKKYSDLDITPDDVIIYKKIRPKFMNASKTITQDVISDMIEVVIDEKKGIYEKLKDKTRSDAISDVKKVYKEWCKDNGENPEIAKKIIWKND
jgi:hypothetical protein